MHISYDIARRYLFKKKRANVINIVTGISILGIAIGTAALVIILSVFNGFESLLSGQFNAFNPDYKVIPAEGKSFNPSDETLAQIKEIEGVEYASRVIEEVALFEYKGTQEIGMIKGVDEDYHQVIKIDTFLLSGKYKLNDPKLKYGIVGLGMKVKLNININDRLNPVTVYMFSRKKRMVGGSEFTFSDLYPSGVFSVRSETDSKYVLGSLSFAEKLIGTKNQYSAIELKTKDDIDSENLRNQLTVIFDEEIRIKNKFEQDEAFLKIMNIEKWVSYLIVSLTLLLVVFNLVVCLWMIVLDKKKDISVMKSFGFDSGGISRIFLNIGLFIAIIGMLAGFIISLVLYYLQSQHGLIAVPDGFMISAYPIKLKLSDFIIVGLTVMIMGFLASILPALKAGRASINFSQ